MRLLDTESLKIQKFIGRDIPQYGILSHCWRNEEVLFHDIQDLDRARQMAGFAKIQNLCKETRQFGYKWAWVDTCCIDKTSSAELSEAINSMYHWYERADTCFVYLDDVDFDDPRLPNSSFRRSRWFTRGWTLQELIATKKVIFFTRSWVPIGTKETLIDLLHDITKIPQSLLSGGSKVTKFSIAQRMSWAANRQTTLVEDRAYSLMGLFNLFIPVIYGEGNAAFQRLQREIIQRSADQSIFAWTPVELKVNIDALDLNDPNVSAVAVNWQIGLLATSPSDFECSAQIESLSLFPQREEFTHTHIGVRIRMPLVAGSHLVIGFLECGKAEDFQCGIILFRNAESGLYQPWHTSHDGSKSKSTPLIRIPWPLRQRWLDRAQTRTIVLSHQPAACWAVGDGCYISLPQVHRGRLTLALENNIIVKLKEMGFAFSGHSSIPGNIGLERHWEAHSTKDGDLLLEYRFDSHLNYSDSYRLEVTSLRQSITNPFLLFRNRGNRKAFSLEFRPSGNWDSVFPSLSVKLKAHSSHIDIKAACKSGVDSRAYEVHSSKSTIDSGTDEVRVHYTTYSVKASSLLDLVSRYT